jgi:hypothetical protein
LGESTSDNDTSEESSFNRDVKSACAVVCGCVAAYRFLAPSQPTMAIGQTHLSFNVIMGLSQKQGVASWRMGSPQHRLWSTSQSWRIPADTIDGTFAGHPGHCHLGRDIGSQRLARCGALRQVESGMVERDPLFGIAAWSSIGRHIPTRVCGSGCRALPELFCELDPGCGEGDERTGCGD